MIPVALALMGAAMVLVRLGWSSSRQAAYLGWMLAAGALVMLTASAGAWGLAIATVVAMILALTMVLYAGWTAPIRMRRAGIEAASVTLPRLSGDLARRVIVFVLVVPVAFVAAQLLAFGIQAVARRAGIGDADATASTLFLQPLIWTALITWQMSRTGPLRMIAAPVAAALLGSLLWGIS